MKLKNKILLGASSLLVLSGAAATTGTFAWYTANRQATVNVTNMSVTSQVATLSITMNKLDDDTIKEDEAGGEEGVRTISDTTNKLVDVSGNGSSTASFVKPYFDFTGNGGTSNVAGWWDEATYKGLYANSIWYHKFTYKFSISNQDVALYVSPKSSVKTNSDTGRAANVDKSVRVSALIDTVDTTTQTPTAASSTKQVLYMDFNGDTTPKYWGKPSESTTVEPTENNVSVTDGAVLTSTFFTGDSAENNKVADFTKGNYNNYTKGYLGDIAKDDSIYISFIVWIEGTDSNTKLGTDSNADDSTGFDLDLQFYTLQIGDIPAASTTEGGN